MLRAIAARTASLTVRPSHCFSSLVDPYFILGVDRNSSFPQIKKAFYKLANQFHPDKNDSQQAQKKFVVVKQAFETIKMEKGLMKPQNLYRSEDRDSMRPHPQKYSAEDAENAKNFTDYTVFSEKAGASSKYAEFNSSFRTIHDINSIKIKVEEGAMKDPTSRFNLGQYRGRISSYSESGNKYFFVVLTCLVVFTIIANQIFSEKEVEQKESALKKLTEVHRRKTIESELIEYRKMDLVNLERSQDIIEMKKTFLMESVKANHPVNLISDTVLSPERINRV